MSENFSVKPNPKKSKLIFSKLNKGSLLVIALSVIGLACIVVLTKYPGLVVGKIGTDGAYLVIDGRIPK